MHHTNLIDCTLITVFCLLIRSTHIESNQQARGKKSSSKKAVHKPISPHILTPTKQNRASMPFYNGSLEGIIASANGKNEDRNDIGEGWVGTLESYKISQRERRRTIMSTTPSSMNSENSPRNLHENEQKNAQNIENSPSSIHKNEQNSGMRRLVPTPESSQKRLSSILVPGHEIMTGFYFEGASTAASSLASSPHYDNHHYNNNHYDHDHEAEEEPQAHESVIYHSTTAMNAIPFVSSSSSSSLPRPRTKLDEDRMDKESVEVEEENGLYIGSVEEGIENVQELTLDDDDMDDGHINHNDNVHSLNNYESGDHDYGDSLSDFEGSEEDIVLERQGLQRIFPSVPEPTSSEYHDLYENAIQIINGMPRQEEYTTKNAGDVNDYDNVAVSSSFERAVGEMMISSNHES